MPFIMTAELLFIGWELNGNPELFEHITSPVVEKVISLPYLSDGVNGRKVENYVKSCLAAGSGLKKINDLEAKNVERSTVKNLSNGGQPSQNYVPDYIIAAFQDQDSWKEYDDNNQEILPA